MQDEGYSPEQIAQEIISISNTVEHIGFIGLGAMGFGMATQLIKSNYRVCGFDVCMEYSKTCDLGLKEVLIYYIQHLEFAYLFPLVNVCLSHGYIIWI